MIKYYFLLKLKIYPTSVIHKHGKENKQVTRLHLLISLKLNMLTEPLKVARETRGFQRIQCV